MSNHSNQEDEDFRDPATRAFDRLRDELASVRQSMEDLRAGIHQSLPGDKQDENLATIRMRKMTPAA